MQNVSGLSQQEDRLTVLEQKFTALEKMLRDAAAGEHNAFAFYNCSIQNCQTGTSSDVYLNECHIIGSCLTDDPKTAEETISGLEARLEELMNLLTAAEQRIDRIDCCASESEFHPDFKR